jgi:2-polyprenyl-6-methoxyphenol hydroxylase-like FAD-dependent oxidoreductase
VAAHCGSSALNASVNKAMIIGGLSAALARQRADLDVTEFERTSEVREVGAGLAVWANAIKALRQLAVAYTIVRSNCFEKYSRTA